MSVCAVQRLPHESSESSWRTEIFEFLIEEKTADLAVGKFRHPVMMLAIDGARAPTRPEPSP